MVTQKELIAAMEVLEDEIGTSDMQWLRKITTTMLEAAFEVRARNPWPEPKLIPTSED